MDVTRLNDSVRWRNESDRSFSGVLIEQLVRDESARIEVQLDIGVNDTERRQRALALYYALTQGIVRGADAIYRESGLRSLWLGYPFLLARDIADPENKRSIFAPLYLWPIRIQASLKRQGDLLIERDAQAGPPIFNRVLARWAKVNLNIEMSAVELDANGDGEVELNELDAALRQTLSAFPELEFADLKHGLVPLPTKKETESRAQPAVISSAVLGLFVSENQALIENLEQMQNQESIEDPLDSILANRQAEHVDVVLPPESDRYLVTDSDPYQEVAIWESRQAPGSIVHGPPGTGKSQTIVNVIADCLARNERILVVCQKRAAIDVVAERLRGVGLDSLCCVVHDSESDRRQIFADLKDQINGLREYTPTGFDDERSRLAQEIDRKESELETYHRALHQPRAEIGLSYRQLIGRATSLYNRFPSLKSHPAIEELFCHRQSHELEIVEQQLEEIVHLWEAALPLVNPWINRVRDFALTKPVQDEITSAINDCLQQATVLESFVLRNGIGIIIETETSAFTTLAKELSDFAIGLRDDVRREYCALWLSSTNSNASTLASICSQFDQWSILSGQICQTTIDLSIQKYLEHFESIRLEFLLSALGHLKRRLEKGWWITFTPSYRRSVKCWNSFALPDEMRSSLHFIEAVERQCQRNLTRLRVITGLKSLKVKVTDSCTDAELDELVQAHLRGARDAAKIANVNTVQLAGSLAQAVNAKVRQKLETWIAAADTAIQRAGLIKEIEEKLLSLQRWLKPEYLKLLASNLRNDAITTAKFRILKEYLPRLPQLCAFSSARAATNPLVDKTLAALESGVRNNPTQVWREWQAILRYSALSSWINYCVEQTPILQSLTPELYERDRKSLATAIDEKRSLEVEAIKDKWLYKQTQLHSLRPSPLISLRGQLVTRGPNSKRLRQAIALGTDLGMFTLRPCWMMNPNTACQVFQLKPGFFDVVIFDEASQCPLEQAVPILHRGKRVIVAGDEKQLPPTSFFLSVTPFDDEDGSNDEDISEEQLERDLRKGVLAQRDVLSVCETVLRNSYLDMHYRSEHPYLIQFSNKAFYGGRLQCPPSVRSDGTQVPIEVVEANGMYDRQSNPKEADAVVALLKRLWLDEEFQGTLGVVTFNLKQEDLIQNLLQVEALRDEKFRLKYEAECNRQDGRQDVGFFVKNLESVQGDERDVMIFSTTFGVDSKGLFRRFFGPLNTEGGEKRLNVAVTRARKKIFIVTSLPVAQISDVFGPAGSSTATRVSGRDYLQAYMRYAQAVSRNDHQARENVEKQLVELGKLSGTPFAESKTPIDFDSDFERSVYECLIQRELQVDTQVGDSGFSIDLAVRHPQKPDLYVLGIECDGRMYHSRFTARARDIWRQKILEGRGWKIHRIWSTNWWLDPDGEIEKIMVRIQAGIGAN